MKIRNTIQRSLVLKAVRQLQNHATVDEIYSTISEEHADISKATVYRNLNILTDIGEIQRIGMIDGPDRYDHLSYKHYHAKCAKCGRIFDVEMEIIQDLGKNIKDTNGFEFSDHDIIFNGICKDCRDK